MMKKRSYWLIGIGSIVNVCGLLGARFFKMPDLLNGMVHGIGIGLLLLAVLTMPHKNLHKS